MHDAAIARTSKGEEDLARKTTGKPRDPKPADTAQPDPVDTAEVPSADAQSGMTSDTPQPADTIDDAEVVSETPPAPTEQAPEAADLPDQATDDPAQPASDDNPETQRATATDAPQQDTAQPPAPAAKPSLVPMLLGGAFAAALGYGAHMLAVGPPAPLPDMSALETELASLRAEVQGLNIPAAFDPAPLQGQIAELGDAVAALENAAPAIDPARLDALGAQVQAVADRAAAIVSDMDAMRADMDALQLQMAELRDLAENRVSDAEAAIDAAMARAGLDSLRAALETGAPFGSAVTQISQAGIDVPDPLAAVAGAGIVTSDALVESFDASARAALRASLTDAPAATTTERLGNFLRAQVGARSTVAREGDDADAVLSRAGAAVDAGDFDTALQELTALPDAGRAAMADWIDAAQARAAALAALPDLTHVIAP